MRLNQITNSWRKWLISNILLFLFFAMNAQSNQSIFEEANLAYRNGNYAIAIELYERILSQGYEASELYYNLGNAYYRTNSVAKSILYFEKAKLLAPNDRNIEFNLEKSNLLVKQKVEPLPEFFLHVFFAYFRNFFGIGTWTTLSIIFFMLMIVFAIIFVFSASMSIRKWSFALSVFMIVFFGITFWAGYSARQQVLMHKTAIVMKTNTEAFSSPDKIGVLIFTLTEGVKVEITSIRQDWVEIRLADGKIAWLPASSIELI
jgi:tetratricopeptide (TPR) repeat protein